MPTRSLNCGGGNLLDNLFRRWTPDEIRAMFLKDDAVRRDLHDAGVEQRVLLFQEVRLSGCILDERKVAGLHLHDALERQLIDHEATFAGYGAVRRTFHCGCGDRTQERI